MKTSTNNTSVSKWWKLKQLGFVLAFCTCSLLLNAQNTSNNFSQVTTNPPTNPISWVYGILNQHNSQYAEGMAVPQRITLTSVGATTADINNNNSQTHILTFKVQYQRKNGTNYAFDFLTSWGTAVANAASKLDQLTLVECSPHAGETVPTVCGVSSNKFLGTISGEPNLDIIGTNEDLSPYFDDTQTQTRNFTIYSTVTITSATLVATGTEQDGSNSYLNYTLTWTNNDPGTTSLDVVIEFAAHLAKTRDGYNGAGFIKGAPYHLKLGAIDGSSLGSQDNNVAVYQNTSTCNLVANDVTLTTCETSAGSGAGIFDLTSSSVTSQITSTDGATITWYSDADLTTLLSGDLSTFSASNGLQVYADVATPDGCEAVAVITFTVNPLPTFALNSITSTTTCKGSPNGTITLSSSSAGVSYQLQTCTGSNVGDPKSGGSPLTWTGLLDGCYKIVATNTTTTCSNTSDNITVTGVDCSTTYTKGFWSGTGKEKCPSTGNRNAITILQQIFHSTTAGTGDVTIFGGGNNMFTLTPGTDFWPQTDGGCKPSLTYIPIQRLLPGGTTPDVLHNAVSWSNKPSWSFTTTVSGKKVTYTTIGSSCGTSTYSSIQNNLLAQTLALQFNLKYSNNLGAIKITGTCLNFAATDCNKVISTSTSTQPFPQSVLTALGSNNTINDLFVLANHVLANDGASPVSAADVTAALNAINVGFDGGKALMSQTNCSTSVYRNDVTTQQVQLMSDLTLKAYPNPYTNKVNFTFTSLVSGKASLQVFNELGQNVKLVFQGYLQAGQTQTVNFDVPPAMRSMLIYKLQVGDQQLTGKVLQAKE